MRVIGRVYLEDFWKTHPEAKKPLETWHHVVVNATWKKFADVRQTYPHADYVDHWTIFNVGGNKYRIISNVIFENGDVHVRRVLTHAEYSKDRWKDSTICQS